jgi:RHS repeat-associated protein
MEKDDEVKGVGNSYTTEFRQYDPRIGRWLSVDPMSTLSSSWTPYRFGFDNPNIFNDLNGLFETRKEARKYKNEHHIRGKIKSGSDTKFEIRGKSGVTYSEGDDTGHHFDKHKNDGVVESITVFGDKNGNSSNNSSSTHSWLEGVNLSFAFNGLTKPLSSSRNPFEDNIEEQSKYIQEQWRKSRAISNSIEEIVIGNFVLGLSPLIIGESIAITSSINPALISSGKYSMLGKISLNYSSESISSGSMNPLNHNILSYPFAAVSINQTLHKQILIGASSGLIEYNINDNIFKGFWNQNVAITTLKVINGSTSPIYGNWYGGIIRQGIGGYGINELEKKLNKQ